MTTYATAALERLDLICWRHYGHLAGTIEAVLAHPTNAHLRHIDIARLPKGTRLTLPPEPARQPPTARVF